MKRILRTVAIAAVILLIPVTAYGLIASGLLDRLFPEPQAVYRTIGVYAPEVIGFQPYWLIDKEQGPYERAISTFTYFGLVLSGDGHIQKLNSPQEEEPGWTTLRLPKLTDRLTAAKKDRIRTSLLVHLADEDGIAQLVADPVPHARNLITDVAPIMKEYGYTDLNLDIESFVEASPAARANFTAFVSRVATMLRQQSLGTLTVEIAPRAFIKNLVLNPAEVAPLADTVVLMAYDYHYTGSLVAGPVAPLGGGGSIYEYDVPTALGEALRVIPADKLILGIPFYGYEWDTVSDVPGSPVVPGTGKTASNSRVSGVLSDCTDCRTVFDPLSQSPVLTKRSDNGEYYRQFFYEDERSLTAKLDLAKKLELKGVAVWALGYEGNALLVPLTDFRKYRSVTFL